LRTGRPRSRLQVLAVCRALAGDGAAYLVGGNDPRNKNGEDGAGQDGARTGAAKGLPLPGPAGSLAPGRMQKRSAAAESGRLESQPGKQYGSPG
jgi:hypothetical protein